MNTILEIVFHFSLLFIYYLYRRRSKIYEERKLYMGKYSKKYINICGKHIYVEDLVQSVNEFDKSFGLKLKHPDIWREPENFTEILFAKTDMNIGSLICILNGIDIEDYFETDTEIGYGTICKPISTDSEEFTALSVLNWDGDKTVYNTDSLIFRCRFISLVLSQLLGRTDKIVKREVKDNYKKHSTSEREIMMTKKFINDVIRFVKIMIVSDAPYKNIILKMHEYISYGRKKYDHQELKKLLNGHILNTRSGIKKELLFKRFMDDDLLIYNILKISFMLTTNHTNVDVVPKFKYIEGATVKHDLIKLIEELGVKIIKTGDKKYAPMFRAFVEARPAVYTEYREEAKENYSIHIGLLAIAYTEFVFNDDDMSKFISEVMKKGI